jgi:two-component system nitrogen regulation sensor histidine kinase NtrY
MIEQVKAHAGTSRRSLKIALRVLFVVWLALTIVQWRLFDVGGWASPTETLGVFALVNINIIILLLLVFLTLRNLAKIMFERRHGFLGSRLKTKLVLGFLATTVIPTIILFLASAGFLARSIDGWFSTQIKLALENSMQVARTYYAGEEEATLLAGRVIAEGLARGSYGTGGQGVADELERSLERFKVDRIHYAPVGAKPLEVGHPRVARLPGAERSSAKLAEALKGAESIEHIDEKLGSFLRAVVPVRAELEAAIVGVLLVDRIMSKRLLKQLEQVEKGFEESRQMEHLRAVIKANYIVPLLMVALLIMFAATWFGLYLARSITEPIAGLADATQRVAGGDLDFELEVPSGDEVGVLFESFNLMTRDLRSSRSKVDAAQDTLRLANAQLESSRLYMEAVFDNITAGVVGTDSQGMVTTINSAASEMLGLDETILGEPASDVLPAEAVAAIEPSGTRRFGRRESLRKQIILQVEGMRRTVMVHTTTLRDREGEALGVVIVFNDLTELVKAERAHAWREVARRIAHEIKNPLTPIQLSAQRLRRRYSELLEEADGAVLDEATSTIITQVDGLKQLVNEFSRFAKMPESNPIPSDLNAIAEEVIGLYRPAHPEISFDVHLDESIPTVEVDPEQIKRVLVNLIDNAVHVCKGMPHGQVGVGTQYDSHRHLARVVVSDNGAGLSLVAREKLFEPYFSTKEGGTGLGLAIVKSIVADHRGYVRALDNKPQGTRIVLELPLPGAEN